MVKRRLEHDYFVLACFAAVIALGAFTYSSVTRYNNVKNRVALVKKDAKLITSILVNFM